jgi:hypothetical protein
MSSTDKELIDVAAYCFDLLGIEYGRSDRSAAKYKRKHIYTIEVRRSAAMFRLQQEVPLQHHAKLEKLAGALSFARGLHCKQCGCLHDEQTDGCYDCKKRHYSRAASKRYREKRLATEACGSADVTMKGGGFTLEEE